MVCLRPKTSSTVGDELKHLVRTHHGSSVTRANAHLGLVLTEPQIADMIRSIGP